MTAVQPQRKRWRRALGVASTILMACNAPDGDPDSGAGADAGRTATGGSETTTGAETTASQGPVGSATGTDDTTPRPSTTSGPADTDPSESAGPQTTTTGAETTGGAVDVSFFVTSEGNGAAGGDYGGITGADARCQALAEAAGLGGRVWRAYLSQAAIGGAREIHARDRIGEGPWHNAALELVADDVASLHTVGFDPAVALDEFGDPAGKGRPPGPEHDILTGTNPNGTAAGAGMTCQNWSSASSADNARVGHHDWSAIKNPITTPQNFNSVHVSPCDEAGMVGVLGSGRLYCFAS